MLCTNGRLLRGLIISGLKAIGFGAVAPIPGEAGTGRGHIAAEHGVTDIGNSTDGDGDGNVAIGINRQNFIA